MLIFSVQENKNSASVCVCVCVCVCARACVTSLPFYAQELQHRDVWALQTYFPHLQQVLEAFFCWPVYCTHSHLFGVLEGPGSPLALALSLPRCGPRAAATLAAEPAARGRRCCCCICRVTSALPSSSRNRQRLCTLPCIQVGSIVIHSTKALIDKIGVICCVSSNLSESVVPLE